MGQNAVATGRRGIPVSGTTSSGGYALSLPGSDVLHFIDPVSGSDANNGTSTATPWLTPNHAVNCGDVIVVKTGTWTAGWGNWGTVSNCPSTSGGIDGTGGINAAIVVCSGALGTCNLNTSGGNAFDVNKNNWAIEGFNASTSAPSTGQTFFADACTSSALLHHVIFVNDVATNTGYGFNTSDCGSGHGEDYIAYVGGIAANANNYNGGASFCGGAIDMNAPKNLDTNTGTHMLVKGMFAFNNLGPPLLTVNAGSLSVGTFYHILTVGTTSWTAIGASSNTVGVYFQASGAGSGTGTATTTQCTSDVEPFIWDVWNRFPYTGQGYASDNAAWHNGGFGFQIFGGGASALTLVLDHLTMLDSCAALPDGAGSFFNCSEVNFGIGNTSWSVSLTNSVLNTNKAVGVPTVNNGPAYATNYDSITTGSVSSPVVAGSILWSLATICDGVCAPSSGQPISISCCTGPELPPPTGMFADPSLTSISDLETNWLASPTCSGFATTTTCMGWTFGSQTVAAFTPIADIAPTASGSSGLGYRPPILCSVDAGYPVWMKGLNYVTASGYANGATITESAGLTNKPCGM